MSNQITSTANDPVVPPQKVADGPPDGQPRADARPEAAPPEAAAPEWRPPDLPAVEQVLQLLARAVRQFHTYPATSRLCTEAIAACHKALVSLEGRDQIALRVTPHDLLVDECGVGGGTIIEHELARRLHRAGVAALTVDRAASRRDLSRFCSDLISVHDGGDPKSTLQDLLTEHGVDKLTPRMAYRPEVVDLGAPRPALCNLVERERSRRELFPSAGPAAHLYPPDKGWVRLDPTTPFSTISLVDLAILVEGPGDLAGVLLRLTDDEPAGAGSGKTALELKFSDVTTLFASLDPRLAQLMFAKLARAVLDLEPERRQSLLQRTILPGLLEGTADGRVLKDFPDVDLAESLCLLLDLETAAPEVLSAALDRMDLPAERRQAMAPLLDAGVQSRVQTGRLRGTGADPGGVDRWARKLLQIDAAPRSFTEFAAFDLSVDNQTSAAIAEVRGNVEATDLLIARLRCLSNLVRLEPNPNVVETFLGGVSGLLGELERGSRWQDLASWLLRHRELADSLQQPRPDVADAIGATLNAFCTRDRAMRVVDLYGEADEPRALANALVNAYGTSVAPAFVALLDDPAVQPKARSLVQLMCDHAKLLAPALTAQVGQAGNAAARAIVRVLGFAGPGCETDVAAQLEHRDEQVVREALRALARIGSPHAAALVSARIQRGSTWVRSAAQEALCHFPPALFQSELHELLGRRDFVLHHPDLAGRLLDRAVQTGADSLREALVPLVPLRFRFWNPALARVGLKARQLVKR